ncbi:unnamed protein product [Acanthoscelides obtectus]|nr:unnamed protein product [Acanthoscelides obtectus]CAK1626683.1 hypothetical protein AOBTE_LOCUS4032 [Acanthoscelides obtectus]
MHGEGL